MSLQKLAQLELVLPWPSLTCPAHDSHHNSCFGYASLCATLLVPLPCLAPRLLRLALPSGTPVGVDNTLAFGHAGGRSNTCEY